MTSLALQEKGWTRSALINWLDRSLPISSRRDIVRPSSTLFISKALEAVEAKLGLSLEQLARAKYRLSEALSRSISVHRAVREAGAFQKALLPENALDFATSSEVELIFTEEGYSYNQPYKGAVIFKKHLFRVVGDLDSTGEEHECAVYLERMPQVKTWIRNTARQPNSFWLQTSTDKFYPDFVALLTDGRVLVVEYKGSFLSTADDAKEKQLVGELWAERSGGKCVFRMLGNMEFERIATL